MASKEAALFVVDVGPSMRALHPMSPHPTTPYAQAHAIIAELCHTRIMAARFRTEFVGLLRVGTAQADNAADADGIAWLHHFAPPTIQLMRYLDTASRRPPDHEDDEDAALGDPASDPDGAREPTATATTTATARQPPRSAFASHGADLVDALQLGIDAINTFTGTLKFTRRLYVLTDGGSATDVAELELVRKAALQHRIRIDVIGFGVDEMAVRATPSSPMHQLLTLAEDAHGQFFTDDEALASAFAMRGKDTMSRTVLRAPLRLGGPIAPENQHLFYEDPMAASAAAPAAAAPPAPVGLAIPVWVYKKIQSAAAPSASVRSLLADDVAPADRTPEWGHVETVRTERHVWVDEAARAAQLEREAEAAGAPLPPLADRVVPAVRYGRQVLLMHPEQSAALTWSAPASLHVLGFVLKASLAVEQFVSAPLVFVPEPDNPYAARLFEAFVRALDQPTGPVPAGDGDDADDDAVAGACDSASMKPDAAASTPTAWAALVRIIKRADGSPGVYAVWSHLTDDTCAMMGCQLPFAEDMRPLPETPSLQWMVEGRPPPSPSGVDGDGEADPHPTAAPCDTRRVSVAEAHDAIDAYLDAMHVDHTRDADGFSKWDWRRLYNPVHQRLWQMIRHRALHPDAPFPDLAPDVAELYTVDSANCERLAVVESALHAAFALTPVDGDADADSQAGSDAGADADVDTKDRAAAAGSSRPPPPLVRWTPEDSGPMTPRSAKRPRHDGAAADADTDAEAVHDDDGPATAPSASRSVAAPSAPHDAAAPAPIVVSDDDDEIASVAAAFEASRGPPATAQQLLAQYYRAAGRSPPVPAAMAAAASFATAQGSDRSTTAPTQADTDAAAAMGAAVDVDADVDEEALAALGFLPA
ncbi:hypothetical protein CXG81DRAFT_28412 [Caulochytrium protostelioides]|uniref:Ku domain-containing protein n=1 Tax=Caulochytrium protostelioides TaxID=1555241 RepID=A0A4P9X1J3_9FUNG|nr:hypothetical protein CXG81DRAFT_28412 [Caulochytrium protostelioides]|eukprot:RKO98793.1 hypothetical protein CXG81DRAFT_28412 [Caulochytrium protostelioides]